LASRHVLTLRHHFPARRVAPLTPVEVSFLQTPDRFPGVTETPIACTLTASEKTARGDEWRLFLATTVAESIRTETSVRMRLIDGDDVILHTVDLARREKDCCAFFEFRLELLTEAIWLEVGVPAEAASLLDIFVNSGAA
jgi:hypothetical protein